MGLSSNSLIHFTYSKESLIGILKDEFKIKYCSEKVITQRGVLNYAIPMVCFCDIPLSEIKNHISKYGTYGIGLKKEWGIKNGLNPVFYVEKNSTVGNNYFEAFSEFFVGKNFNDFNSNDFKQIDVIRYMKNYEADLIIDKINKTNYRFADEKEWRFVLPKEQAQFVVKNETYQNNKNKYNDKVKNYKLSFNPEDISYVIINNDNEISDFIDILKKSKGKKYPYDEVERLITRLITVEQILNDF
jgi:hypothetical protein